MKTVGPHMTLSDRIAIEQGLRDGDNFKEIAEVIHKDPTTVSKEIKRSVKYKDWQNETVDCIHVINCRKNGICRNKSCNAYCKECPSVDCTKNCKLYAPRHCKELERPPYVCNACPQRISCHLEKKYYKAKEAQKSYEKRLRDSRSGINMTAEELKQLNSVVSPLILQHQSLSHIYSTHSAEIGISRPTLYKYIAEGILDAKTMDLPRKIRYKKRKKAKHVSSAEFKYRSNRTYRHFENYMANHSEINVVEMDTVKGCREKDQCLLTMLFRNSGLMLIFLLPNCTMAAVVRVFNKLTDSLGLEDFQKTFPVILTDNGPEFKNADGMERTPDGKLRTKIFYCDPLQSNQKSRIERSHQFIRYIIPKGISLYWLTDDHVRTMTDHINSAKRDSLNHHSPYEMAEILMDKKVLDKLNLKAVSPDLVQLNPALLRK